MHLLFYSIQPNTNLYSGTAHWNNVIKAADLTDTLYLLLKPFQKSTEGKKAPAGWLYNPLLISVIG